VKESLHNHANGKNGAMTIERWPMTMQHFYPEVLHDVVGPMLATNYKDFNLYLSIYY
jgi:hypothetical protein